MLIFELAQLTDGSIFWPDEEEEAYRAMGWYGGPGGLYSVEGVSMSPSTHRI